MYKKKLNYLYDNNIKYTLCSKWMQPEHNQRIRINSSFSLNKVIEATLKNGG